VAVIVMTGFGFGIAKAYSAVTAPNPQCTAAHVMSAEPNAHRSEPPATLQTALDYFAQGDDDYDQGNCAKAIADYTQAIKLNAHYAEAYNNRAYTYMQENDYAHALPDLDQAIQFRPGYVHALMNRGDLYNYYYQIDRQKAISDYDQVIALGAAQGTSVCSHRILAVNNGWSVGAFVDIFTHLQPPLDGC
jgi:tetratricopeptide (TPR) repeat protein